MNRLEKEIDISRKRFTPEQIIGTLYIGMLRVAEVRHARGQSVGEICLGLEVSDQSNDRWRREYRGKVAAFPVQFGQI